MLLRQGSKQQFCASIFHFRVFRNIQGAMVEARSPQEAQESASGSGKAPSCIPLFDALWFCYCESYVICGVIFTLY